MVCSGRSDFGVSLHLNEEDTFLASDGHRFSVQAFDLRPTPIIADHGAYSNVGQKVALCSREHGRSVDISAGL